MKILRIGDPHVRPTNLDEWENLAGFIHNTILERKPDRVEILGDLFHTHAVLRLEVLDFWDAWLDIFSEAADLFVLVGNHDMTGDYQQHTNALSVFKRIKRKTLHIIENPQDHGLYAYMPYYHDAKEFVEVANRLAAMGCKVLVCHQTFSGSQFENGMYAPDGIDPDLLNFDLIISGHIHKHQRFGKVLFPGTSRWDTNADANENKGIWLYEHDDVTGAILSEELIQTKHVVTKIVSIVWEEGKDLPAIESGVKTTVELIGSSQWVNEHKKSLKGRCAVKTKITDRIDKSERKPGKNFHDFVSNIYITTMDRPTLLKYMKENSIV